ncbi:TPA: hypothetical protein ACH3X1_012334 [Trebouxia sp. C0004]
MKQVKLLPLWYCLLVLQNGFGGVGWGRAGQRPGRTRGEEFGGLGRMMDRTGISAFGDRYRRASPGSQRLATPSRPTQAQPQVDPHRLNPK